LRVALLARGVAVRCAAEPIVRARAAQAALAVAEPAVAALSAGFPFGEQAAIYAEAASVAVAAGLAIVLVDAQARCRAKLAAPVARSVAAPAARARSGGACRGDT
jgi:hypothetical protein